MTISPVSLKNVAKYASLNREELINKLIELESKFGNSSSSSSQSKKPKKARAFDFTKHVQRRIALKISYLGWDYDGFAGQDNTDNTVEAHLFKAFTTAKLIEDRLSVDYNRCGRTDKGVSAHCQVVALNLRSKLPANHPQAILHSDYSLDIPSGKADESAWDDDRDEIPYSLAINQLLPPEIRVLAWAPVPKDFSARFDCQYRGYKYFFSRNSLNIEKMHEAAQKFMGNHDFRNFCRIDKAKGAAQAFSRVILHSSIDSYDDTRDSKDPLCMFAFTIKGTAFLLHQVRCIMALLFLIGEGKEDVSIVDELLNVEKNGEKPPFNMASPIPLVLWECAYKNLEFRASDYNHFKVEQISRTLWDEFAVKATISRGLFQDLLPQFQLYTKEDSNSVITWREYSKTRKTPERTYLKLFDRKPTHDQTIDERLARYEDKRQKKYPKIED